MREEIGEGVRYKLGKPILQFRRHFKGFGWHIFCIVYEAEYVSGEIQLSSEHVGFQWITLEKFREYAENDFFSAEEYHAFLEYFGQFSV